MTVVAVVALTTVATAGAAAPAGAIALQSAGAVAGTATGATAAGAATGAVAAGSSAAAGPALAAFGLNPIGLLFLGTSSTMLASHPSQDFGATASAVTYDCWKPLLHDDSVEPSRGKLLRDVMEDPRIKQVRIGDELVHPQGQPTPLPQLFLVNVWDETYRIDYVVLPDSKLTAHATLVSS